MKYKMELEMNDDTLRTNPKALTRLVRNLIYRIDRPKWDPLNPTRIKLLSVDDDANVVGSFMIYGDNEKV